MLERIWSRFSQLRRLAPLAPLALIASLSTTPAAALAPGDKLAQVALSGEAGGKVDGTPWSSAMIKDKVWLIFYVAPSHRNDNEDMKAALKEADFPLDKLGSIAIVNMAASWLPNSILASSLKSNQEKFPHVTYVKDMDKALVKAWSLPDDAFDVLLVDKSGSVLFAKDGDFSDKQTKDLIALIRKSISDVK